MKMTKFAVMTGVLLGSALVASPLWATGPSGADHSRGVMVLAQGQGGGAGAGRDQGEERLRSEERFREQVREQEAEAGREQAERAREQIRPETQQGQNGAGPQDNRGMEQQRERVMDQEQRELGRGSEQGQTAREENRRKWWRFWDRSGD